MTPIVLNNEDSNLLALAKEAIIAVDNCPLPEDMDFFEQITIFYHYASAQLVCANFERSVECINKAKETLAKINAMLTAVDWSENQLALLTNSHLHQQLAALQEQVDITVRCFAHAEEARAVLNKLGSQEQMIAHGMAADSQLGRLYTLVYGPV